MRNEATRPRPATSAHPGKRGIFDTRLLRKENVLIGKDSEAAVREIESISKTNFEMIADTEMEVPKRKPKGPPPPVSKNKPKGPLHPSPDASLMLLANDSRLEDTGEASENHGSTQLRASKLPPVATTPGSLQEQQLKRENTQLRKDLAALQKDIDAVHDALEDTHDAFQTKADELAVIQQDYTALQKQSQSAQREVTTGRAQIATLQNNLDVARNQIRDKKDGPSSPSSTDDAKSRKKQDELLSQVRKLQQEKQELQQVHDDYIRKSEQEQYLLKHPEDDARRERETLEAARAQWEQAKSKMIDKHQKEKDDLQERLEAELHRETAKSIKQRKELNDTVDDLAAMHKREIDRVKAQHSSELEQIKSLDQKQSQALDSEKAELQNKYADTLKEVQSLEAELSSVRIKTNIANQQTASNFSEPPSIGSAMQIDSSVDSTKLIEEVQASHAAEVEELRRLRDFFQSNSERLSKEIKILKSKNRNLEESVGMKDRELEDQRSHMYAMEEQIEEFQTQNSVPGGWE